MAVSVRLYVPGRPAWVRLLAAMPALALAGCAGPALRPSPPLSADMQAAGRRGECARLYARTDRAVDAAGVRDVQAQRIAGFPYLRVDRFLASFRRRPLRGAAFSFWVDRLQALDAEGRTAEIANLPPAAIHRLAPDRQALRTRLRECAGVLRTYDLARTQRRAALRRRAQVADDYSTLKRALGLYPVTSALVLRGVARLHRKVYNTFAAPLSALPLAGDLVAYGPPADTPMLSAAQVADILRRSEANPLHLPEPRGTDRARLFQTFAPVWQIDVDGPDDRIGTPYWSQRKLPKVDTGRPRVYLKTSHVRLDGRILLQLNYVIWFPARPLRGRWDILGGRLDGITWRVTLDPDGRPLLYDAMHNCGCYHMFFPAARLRFRPPAGGGETPLVPQGAPPLPPGARIAIRIAHATHYLQRVRALSTPAAVQRRYAFANYNSLRSLVQGNGGNRSLFGPNGIVAGTERAERWLLWPTGVPDPGAMRQWGHHAIAFVGRRHFDDPDLIARCFRGGP